MSRAGRLDELEADRSRLLRELARLERRRHAAIVAELDAGASLTAVAGRLGVTRQALTKSLTRRESNHA
jgi:lambda repressor-like predicted transcriptional regulator